MTLSDFVEKNLAVITVIWALSFGLIICIPRNIFPQKLFIITIVAIFIAIEISLIKNKTFGYIDFLEFLILNTLVAGIGSVLLSFVPIGIPYGIVRFVNGLLSDKEKLSVLGVLFLLALGYTGIKYILYKIYSRKT